MAILGMWKSSSSTRICTGLGPLLGLRLGARLLFACVPVESLELNHRFALNLSGLASGVLNALVCAAANGWAKNLWPSSTRTLHRLAGR